MASQPDIREYEVPFFTGKSAEEAEDFIQAVNRRAYAAGKQKDNAWIAEFAYPFFSRKALRWYDSLDEGTQNDWKLLRSAILAEFTGEQPAASTVPSAALAATSSSLRYTPAAPPPPAATKMIGRIRVDSGRSEDSGYLAVPTDEMQLGIVCENINDASLFEADILGQTLTFKGEVERLAIKAYVRGWSLNAGTAEYGHMVRSSTKLGTEWSKTWSVAGNGNVVMSVLEADGRKLHAQFIVPRRGSMRFLYIPADMDKFLGHHSGFSRAHLATLCFELVS